MPLLYALSAHEFNWHIIQIIHRLSKYSHIDQLEEICDEMQEIDPLIKHLLRSLPDHENIHLNHEALNHLDNEISRLKNLIKSHTA